MSSRYQSSSERAARSSPCAATWTLTLRPIWSSSLTGCWEALPVLIDLSQVTFLTSAGIVALLSERTFGRPALFCPDGSVSAKLLAIVQAQRLVPIYRDLDAALKGLGAAA